MSIRDILICALFLFSAAGHCSAQYDRAADPHEFTVFMKDGGWCWYQDPRAILHDGKVIILGSVKGNGAGEALIGVYDLKQNKALGSFTAHPKFDKDDHNSPVFFARPDNRLVAVYARHNRDQQHCYRISAPGNFLAWSEEKVLLHDHKTTYMNHPVLFYDFDDDGCTEMAI